MRNRTIGNADVSIGPARCQEPLQHVSGFGSGRIGLLKRKEELGGSVRFISADLGCHTQKWVIGRCEVRAHPNRVQQWCCRMLEQPPRIPGPGHSDAGGDESVAGGPVRLEPGGGEPPLVALAKIDEGLRGRIETAEQLEKSRARGGAPPSQDFGR